MRFSLGSVARFSETRPTVYEDSPGDRWLVDALTRRLQEALGGDGASVAGGRGGAAARRGGYPAFVSVAFALARGRTPTQQHAFVLATLVETFPPAVLSAVRWLVGALNRVGFPVNLAMAAGTVPFAGWLVGTASVQPSAADVELLGASYDAPLPPTQPQQPPFPPATVVLRKCRFLEESGCRSACFNVCKAPTQAFFAQHVGVPLTMRPNFETLSCSLTFGEVPPPLAEDEAAHGPCFSLCPVSQLRDAQDSGLGCAPVAAREKVAR